MELSRSTAKKTWGGCCDSGSCSSSWPPAHHPTSRGNWSTGAPARQKIETRSWNKKKGANCKFLPDQSTLLEAWWQPGVLWGASSQSDQPWLSGPGTSIGFFKHIQNSVTPPNNRWDGPLDWACQAWDRQSPPSQGIGGGAEHSHSPPSLHNWSEM